VTVTDVRNRCKSAAELDKGDAQEREERGNQKKPVVSRAEREIDMWHQGPQT